MFADILKCISVFIRSFLNSAFSYILPTTTVYPLLTLTLSSPLWRIYNIPKDSPTKFPLFLHDFADVFKPEVRWKDYLTTSTIGNSSLIVGDRLRFAFTSETFRLFSAVREKCKINQSHCAIQRKRDVSLLYNTGYVASELGAIQIQGQRLSFSKPERLSQNWCQSEYSNECRSFLTWFAKWS